MHLDMRVIEVTDLTRNDLGDNLESNIWKTSLQVMRGSPLVFLHSTQLSYFAPKVACSNFGEIYESRVQSMRGEKTNVYSAFHPICR